MTIEPTARQRAATMDDERDDVLLEVRDLTVEFVIGGRWTPVVDGASFAISRHETVGLVGESGSGKTVTALALLGLIGPLGGRVASGSITFDGLQLVGRSDWHGLRGKRIGMIFQQPTRSLDPAFTVGEQIAETVRRHLGLDRRDAWSRAVELLDRVRVPDPAGRARDYPHQFSGGMCQRVMIAIAMACRPDLLIADEPTTALDVTVQATILDLIREVQAETGCAVLFVSHDLAVIAEIAHRVVVMYAGHLVEGGAAERVFLHPQHPYTEGLLASIPTLSAGARLATIAGTVPAPGAVVRGCRFAPRCRHAVHGRCDAVEVPVTATAAGAFVRCVRSDELDLRGITPP